MRYPPQTVFDPSLKDFESRVRSTWGEPRANAVLTRCAQGVSPMIGDHIAMLVYKHFLIPQNTMIGKACKLIVGMIYRSVQ